MTRSLLLVAALLLMSGCPEAPEHIQTADPSTAGGPGGPGGPGDEGQAGAPPEGGGGTAPAGVDIAGGLKYSQEDLAEDTDAITLSGVITCSAEGPYWVYVFPPPPSPDDISAADQEPVGAVSGIKLDAAGPFSFKTPKGSTAMVLAFRDLDSDGVQKPGEPLFIGNDNQPVELSADVSDLSLDCEKNAVGMGGAPPE